MKQDVQYDLRFVLYIYINIYTCLEKIRKGMHQNVYIGYLRVVKSCKIFLLCVFLYFLNVLQWICIVHPWITGLNCTGPFIHIFFSIKVLENVLGDSLKDHFLFSSFLYCKNTVYNLYNIQNMCEYLFMLLVRLPVSSMLLVVNTQVKLDKRS